MANNAFIEIGGANDGGNNGKCILHVDGDNFFVSCELSRFPHLKGKPVIVGWDRGIACAMSYEAKALGVTRGMPVFKIRKEFPQVVILPSHFELYDQYSNMLFSILKKYSGKVEHYSIDECFAEIDDNENSFELLKAIKADAEKCLGISLSFGLAKTKTLAKIASKYKKPSGCIAVTEENVEQLLKETHVGKVWGIGGAIAMKLTAKKIFTAYDFINMPRRAIEEIFGRPVLETWNELKGVRILDLHDKPRVQKSFQATRSFGFSADDPAFLLSELSMNAETICSKLRRNKLKTNSLSFFIKKAAQYDRYISQKIPLPFFTDDPAELVKRISSALASMYDKRYKYKATGVGVYDLRPSYIVQDDLFASQSLHNAKSAYTGVLDSLHKRFGDQSIHLCSSLNSSAKRQAGKNMRNEENKFIYGLPLPYMGETS